LPPIDKILAGDIKLPSPPAIAVRILDTVKKEDSSFRDLADIIASDPALTAKILKIANSSFYSPTAKIDSIQRALSLIGVDTLKNIALSFVIAGNMRTTGSEGFDFDFFWKRAITSAVGAELLATLVRHRSDDTFVTALLQDIGIVIMYFCQPTEYAKVLDEKRISGKPIVEIENSVFGFDHQEMGYEILKRWGLPENIYSPIRYHHGTAEVPEDFSVPVDILYVADEVSSVYHSGHATEKITHIKKILGSKFSINEARIDEYIDSVAEKSIDILSSFEIDPGDMKPFSQLLQEANEELGKLNLSYEQLVIELKQAKEKAEKLAHDLKGANEKLREMVSRDGLTGLYNHRFFQEGLDKELSEAIRYKRPFSLIMFDIDLFKKVNDTYGHPVGDIVLKNISGTVKGMIRSCDIAARYGGEEFALILPETELQGALILAERLRKTIGEMCSQAGDKTVRTTISVGVTSYLPLKGARKKSDILDAADRALYRSKKSGRNRVSAG